MTKERRISIEKEKEEKKKNRREIEREQLYREKRIN